MSNLFEGQLDASGLRFGIVAGRFNELVTRSLLEGAKDALRRNGATEDAVDVAWCPGAFEIPVVAKALIEAGRYDAIICLGAVIRGATSHYDHVASGVASGIQQVSLDSGIPVLFGVLTVDSLEQAFERAGTKAGNKGTETALAAIEMANLLASVREGARQ